MQEYRQIPRNSSETFSGTVIANFANYLSYYNSHFNVGVPVPKLNYVWVRVNQNSAAVNKLRSAFSSGYLELSLTYL